ncbi:putative diguanylate cyclase [Escherichia coli]|uniref:Putative diguanylate cyclase n=1 Tax=Escherichia coli TaxID=562 RepID=A0A376TQ01_ECOLX|nr:putative diguanylate cyclase [Escherichia coli]
MLWAYGYRRSLGAGRVLSIACSLARARHYAALVVNLSALQLMHPNMVADMLELLTRYRIQPGTLILEVTESRRIDDPHAAVAIPPSAAQCRSSGGAG